MTRKIAAIVLMALMFNACIHRFPDPGGADARDVMAQTVKIEVNVAGVKLTKIGEDADGKAQLKVEEGVVVGWSGTGVVVAADASRGKGESLVMSAAHVLNVPQAIPIVKDGKLESIIIVQAALMTVTNLSGSVCEAQPIYVDTVQDVGIARALCVAGNVAELSSELPPIGAQVLTTGAGLGLHPNGVFITVDGRYLGLSDGENPRAMLSMDTAPGHSGSGVFHEGRLFSIVSSHYVNHESITYAVPLEQLQKALGAGMKEWNAN